MHEMRYQARHALVLCGRFTWKPPNQVPQRRYPELLAPFQHLNVVQCGDALAHQLQDVVAEALDAWLDPPDAGGPQQLDLVAFEIALRLVEQAEIDLSRGELRQQRLEVLEVEDVVGDLDVA